MKLGFEIVNPAQAAAEIPKNFLSFAVNKQWRLGNTVLIWSSVDRK